MAVLWVGYPGRRWAAVAAALAPGYRITPRSGLFRDESRNQTSRTINRTASRGRLAFRRERSPTSTDCTLSGIAAPTCGHHFPTRFEQVLIIPAPVTKRRDVVSG